MLDALERYRWFVVAALAVPLFIGLGFFLSERLGGPEPLEIDLEDIPAAEIRVYVSGAVQRPGVYTIDESDRWIDALEMAGGPTADADIEAVNLAQRLHDEDHVHIPRRGETTAVSGELQEGKININTASEAVLETLPAIGKVRAAQIVQSRQNEGPFASIEELLQRQLIPSSVYDQIKDLIGVGP